MRNPTLISIPISKKNQQLHIPSSSLLSRHQRFLRKLSQVAENPKQLKKLLKKATASEIKSLVEVVYNLLKNTYPGTSRKLISLLKPFKKLLRQLTCCQTNVAEKRRLLLHQNQKGSGLPFLIPLLAPIVGQLIASGISARL